MRKLLILLCFCFPVLLYAQDTVSLQQAIGAEKMFDLKFTDAKRDSLVGGLTDRLRLYEYMHKQTLINAVPLPLWFDPVLPGMHFNKKQQPINWNIPANVSLPTNKNELAFYSISQLASLIKSKKISSVELTRFFIDRLKNMALRCIALLN